MDTAYITGIARYIEYSVTEPDHVVTTMSYLYEGEVTDKLPNGFGRSIFTANFNVDGGGAFIGFLKSS